MSVKEVRVVRNACAVLEAVARTQPVGVSELARLTGIDKSAAHRLAITLQAAGWLERAPEGRWCIAATFPAVVQEGAGASLAASARPLLERARSETDETAMLVVAEGLRLRIAAVAECLQNLRVSATEGVEEVRTRGWSVNDAELTPDARGVASALLRADGSPAAALVVCGPVTRFRTEDAGRHGSCVARLAAEWQQRDGTVR